MAYEPDIDESQYRKVRPLPDDDPPTEWPWSKSVCASWITPDLIEEVLEG